LHHGRYPRPKLVACHSFISFGFLTGRLLDGESYLSVLARKIFYRAVSGRGARPFDKTSGNPANTAIYTFCKISYDYPAAYPMA
jgi:hypothetical protein